MAKKKLTDWGSLSGDLEKDRKKEEQKPKTQTTQIGTGINNDWSLLTGNSKNDRSNIAKRQEEYKKSAAAYQAQMDSINRTSKRSQVMMQGFHNDPVKQAQSEKDYHAKELARNAPLYQQISKEARKFSDYGTFNAAQSGLRQSSGNFADSYERYQQASQKAREDYLENLKQTNKSQYYGETMSRQQIEQKLGQLAREKGRAVTNADRASELAGSDQDRAKVYSSQAGDGRQPDYMRQLWDAKDRSDELDAEIARYQAALKYRNSLDKDAEMEEMARSISSLSNFREMSEVGKAMVEGRNKSARASVDSMDYQPDDPDNNLQFARAEQQEREALGKAGYVSDLDSSYIPEEVKPIYYALFVQSPQKAQEFASYWADKGEQSRWNALYEKSGEDAGTRARAFIEGTFANTVAGLDPFGEGGQYAAKLGKTMIGGGAAGLTEKGLFNSGKGAGVWHTDLFGDISLGSAYQLGSSMLQSAANATLAKMTGGTTKLAEWVGGAGTILLGSSAAASDYQEKLEQGWDESAAKLHALAAGTAESLFEYVSMDKLIKEPLQLGVGAKWRDIIKQGVRTFFVQGGVEASEEVSTTLANRVTDALISELSGNENQIQAKVRELMEQGYEKGTAEKMAEQEWLTEVMSDALGGFLSGGLMSAGQYAMYPVYKAAGAVQTNRYNERTGALSSRTGEAAALAQYAADNNLGWTAPEQSAEAVNQSESGTQGAETQNDVSKSTLGQKVTEAAEEKKTRKELRQERKETRQIGADVNRVRSHIQEQFAGKTVQQQEAIRDELVKKYGEGMELPVYRAVSMETAKQAMEMESTDAIRQARETVLAEIQDEDMKRAVAEGYDQAAYQKAAQSNDLNAAAKYIQQVRNTGSGEMSMTATVAGEDGQSRQVRIADMTEDGKGVKLEDGTVVEAKDLVADADTMDVVKQLARLNLGRDASAVLQAYRDSGVAESEGYRWIMDYATAYEQGRTARISLKQAVERSSLDAKTVMDAYQKGQQYAQAETEKAEERKNKARKKGVTGRKSNIDTSELTRKGITYEKMTDAERRQYDLANKIFELIGVDLRWIASDVKTDSRGQEYYSGVNGSYLNGVVTLDIHAGQNYIDALRSGVFATTGHELTHFLEQYAPKQYKALKEFVFQQIVENSANGEQTLERMIWEKQKRSKFRISSREAEHEVVADACQEMLLDSEAIREFAAENEEAAKGMVRWLRDFFAKIKAAFRQSTELTEQARFMAGLEKDVRKAFGKLWDEALREAVKAHDEIGNMENPATEGGEQFSTRDEVLALKNVDWMDNWSRLKIQLDVHRNDIQEKFGGRPIVEIQYGGETENALLDKILEQALIAGKPSADRKSASFNRDGVTFEFNSTGLKQLKKHASSNNALLAAAIISPYIAKDGLLISGHKNHEGHGFTTLTYAAPATINGTTINVAVAIMFDDSGRPRAVGVDTDQGRKFVIKNEEVPTRIRGRADIIQSGDGSTHSVTSSKVTIPQNENEVNPSTAKNSDRDTEYLEFAKDPEKNQTRLQEMVVRAAREAGYNSPVLYHGTRQFGFTVFDKQKSDDKKSFFVTSSNEIAQTYSGQLYARAIKSRSKPNTELLPHEIVQKLKKIPYYFDAQYFQGNDTEGKKYLSGLLIDRLFRRLDDIGWFYGGDKNAANLFEAMGAFKKSNNEKAIKETAQKLSNIIFSSSLMYANGVESDMSYELMQSLRLFGIEEGMYWYNGDIHTYEDSQEQLKQNARYTGDTGNYALLGKTDNFLEVDGQGERWDHVPKPDEMSDLYNAGRVTTRQIADYAFNHGYNGVIIRDIEDNGGRGFDAKPGDVYVFFESSMLKSADPVTYDDSGNVIPLSERFNTKNPDIRFSMREPVETTDRLIAWHNMNEDALRSALELGGLAMPSWAIKTADRAHTSYGKISVIAPRELVDPKLNRSSMIFGGDAWTPVFPDIDYDVSFEAAEDLYDEITGLIGENVMRELGGASIDTQNIAQQLSNNGGAVSNYYKNNVALRYAYLKSIGKDINVPRREVRLDQSGQYDNQDVQMFAERLVNGQRSLQHFRSMTGREVMQQEDLKKAITDVMVARHGEEVRDLYAPDELSFRNVEAMLSAANRFFENGGDVPSETDRYALAKEIDKVIDEAAYEKWIGEKLNNTVTKKGVYNGKDPFTPSGNRRSFDALHYAYNLANIVKAMKSQPKQGRTQFLSGPGSVKGAALKSYNTVEQVRKDRGRLVNSAEEGQAAYDAYNRNLEDILDRMSKNGDRFDAADALIEVFQHAKTEAAIYNYMQRELKDWYNISRELAHDAYELIGQINALPMEYFEGKTYDAVRFDETAAVVVPDNIDPALKRQLEDAGARVVEYKAGDDADRLAKVNSVEGAQFSERDYDQISDLELMDNAVEGLTEAGGEEYWNALLESAPELADDKAELKSLAEGYKKQGEKLAKAEAALEEAKRQMTPGGNRKLNTKGISGLALDIMKSVHAGDVHNKQVAKNVAQILAQAYQKGLNAIDAGKDPGAVWDIVYREGVEKAADFMLENATYSEKFSYKWVVSKLGDYLKGEDGRWSVIDAISAKVIMDWSQNRMRQRMEATKADKLIERTENRMQKQIDEAKARANTAESRNAELEENVKFLKQKQEENAGTIEHLGERLEEARKELKESKGKSAKEQKAALDKAKRLNNRLQAKRQEAAAWKKLAERNEALLNAALKSKNADIDALRVQMDRNATEAAKKQAALVQKLTEQVEREKRILEGKLKPPAMQRLLRAERERAARVAEAHKDEVFQNYKERQRQGDLRQRIRNLSDEMKRRMTNPSERAYVPASLYESMTRLADLLDDVLSPKPGTKAAAKYRAMMDAIHGLAREYSAVKDMDDPTYSSEYDTEIQDAISEIERVLERKDASWLDELTGDTKKGLRELSTGELQRIYELMRSINYSMVGATAMLGHSGFKNVFDAMRSVAEQQQTITPLNEAGKAETAKRSRLMHKLSTMRAVEMMSGWQRDAALYQLMHDIEQGVADADGWVMNYDKSMQALKTGKNELEYRRAISKKLDDYNVKDARGNKVLMTKMQALQILMTAEREAHNDKLVHLQRGGAVIRDRNAGTSYTIKVTPELIQKIQNSLTEWDRAYMKAIRYYFRTEGKRTNEILYKLKHKVLQTEEYYVPYNVDKNYLETKLDSPEAAMSMWVKTPGATNALAQKASQPVYIDGMDTVMGQHVREIANYIGMAIPIRDFSKVYNGMLKQGDGVNPLPVKETIHNNYGDDGQRLLTQAIIDVQGGRKPNEHRTQLGKLLDKLQSAFYRKSLLINAGVTLKQAASYIAAESILSHTALERGNHPAWTKEEASNAFGVGGLIRHLFLAPSGKTAQRLFNEIDEHTSLHYQRRQGMSMQELAQEANRSGRIKTRLGLIGAGMEQYKGGHTARMIAESVDPLNWIQRMDVATTAALWVACKEQAKLDGMKSGTQEYWNHVTELYERCIRETQPMYDTLHRSEDQKDRSGLMQYLFPFRTVPIQNHGQLAASFEAFKAAQKSGDEARIKQAGTFFRKTAIAQTLSAAVFAAFTLFAAVSKRKTKKYRDEDEELTPESLGFGVGRDIFGTLFSVFFPMFGSAAWDTINTGIDYAKSGKEAFSYDAFSIGVADMLNNLWQTGGDLGKDVVDLIAGRELNSDDVVKHIGKMVVSGLECAGVPTTTAKSYWNGIKGNFADLKEGRIPALNDESWERKIGVNAQRLVKAAQAGDSQKVQAVLEEMRGNILEEKPNLKEDKVNGRIQNAVTSYVKGLFLDGKLSEAETTKLLVQYGSSDDENEAYWKIREWEAKAAHADDDEYSFNKYEDLRAILADNGDISSEVKRLTDHGVKADNVNKDVKATIKDLFNNGTITEDEAMAMLQKYHQTKDDKTKQYRADTADEAWFIVDEWKEGAESDEEDFNYTKYSDLREAIRTGGDIKDEIDLLTGHGVKEKDLYEDVNKTIKTMLSDGAINGDKAEDLLRKYGKVKDSETKAYRAITEDEAWAKVREWQGKIEHADEEDYSYGKYDEIDAAIDGNKDIKALVKELTDHGTKEKDVTDHIKEQLVKNYVDGKTSETALKNQLSRYCKIVGESADKLIRNANVKKATGYSWDDLDNAYRDGNVSAAAAKQALTKYGKLSTADANARIRYWDFKKAYPDSTMQQDTVDKYYNSSTLQSSGLTLDNYVQYYTKASKATGTDKNGDGRTDSGSLKAAKMQIINGLNITRAQKDALYYFNGWSAKTIWEAPWH